jgi:hypothetical protein
MAVQGRTTCLIILFLLLAFLLPNYSFGQDPAAKPGSEQAKAEEQYSQFLALYRKPAPSKAELEKALSFVKAAYDLSPSTYKFAFSQGAVYYSLGRYTEASEWFARSRTIAGTEDQRQATQVYRDDCNVQLAKARVKDWGKPGFEMIFTMKQGTVEMERQNVAKLPQRLPKVDVGEPAEPLMTALTAMVPGTKAIKKDVFVIAGYEDEARLERHYDRGVKDFYRFFKGRYFPDGTKRVITIFIAPNPEPLLAATKKLYPDVGIPLYAPFLGYYNPRDNLIMATGGEAGYGTVLHEMVHALMESDFPGAPLWLVEGLASLYERTRWSHSNLEPLPNWRMDQLKEATVGSMADIAGQIDKADLQPQQMAKVRLLLLFFEQQGRMADAYSMVKKSENKMSAPDLISRLGLKETSWQAFVQQTFRDYRVEVSAGNSSMSNPDEVRFVQAALNKTMNAGLKVDGIWGSTTTTKVKEFQRKFNLPANGIAGAKTLAELRRQFTLGSAGQ